MNEGAVNQFHRKLSPSQSNSNWMIQTHHHSNKVISVQNHSTAFQQSSHKGIQFARKHENQDNMAVLMKKVYIFKYNYFMMAAIYLIY